MEFPIQEATVRLQENNRFMQAEVPASAIVEKTTTVKLGNRMVYCTLHFAKMVKQQFEDVGRGRPTTGKL